MAAIGIMGGTFNPIHLGHIAIAKAAYEQFHLDEIWFMPNHIPAYKSNQSLVSGEQRLAMIQLAIQAYPFFKASDFELKREGKTYTYETMQLLKQQYPQDEFYFIMGADSLYYFENWVYPEIILENAKILAAVRNQKTTDEMLLQIDRLNKMFKGSFFYLIDCPEIPCSSSTIRDKIQQIMKNGSGEPDLQKAQDLMLPDGVLQYIIQYHLYD